jgi:hypothetical protein
MMSRHRQGLYRSRGYGPEHRTDMTCLDSRRVSPRPKSPMPVLRKGPRVPLRCLNCFLFVLLGGRRARTSLPSPRFPPWLHGTNTYLFDDFDPDPPSRWPVSCCRLLALHPSLHFALGCWYSRGARRYKWFSGQMASRADWRPSWHWRCRGARSDSPRKSNGDNRAQTLAAFSLASPPLIPLTTLTS